MKTVFTLVPLFIDFIITSKVQMPNYPFKLKKFALESLEAYADSLHKDSVKILTRICPSIFEEDDYHCNMKLIDKIFLNSSIQLSKKVDLSDLDLNSIPEFICTKFENLEEIILDKNQKLRLTDKWFDHLPKDKIRKVSLANNCLDMNDLKMLDKIPNLEELNISYNRTMDIQTEEFANVLSKLKNLNVSSSSLSGKDFDFICFNGKNLEELNFSFNILKYHFTILEDDIVVYRSNCLRRLKSLKSLNLSNCLLKSQDLEQIFVCPELKEINLSGNVFIFEKNLIRHLFRPAKVSSAELAGEQANSNPDHETDHLEFENPCLNSLESISINSYFTEIFELYSFIFNMKNLKVLKLGYRHHALDFSIFRNCKAKDSLQKLELDGFILRDSASMIEFLNNFTKLESLSLLNMPMGEIPENFSFGNLTKKLTHLQIDDCKFNSHGLKAIAECENLTYLRANFNDFSNLSEYIDFKSKDKLVTVEIENSYLNHFGLISIARCNSIKRLYLRKNNFENLPESPDIDTSKSSLEELHVETSSLNKNHLNFLISFPKLQKLCASYNNLRGIDKGFKLKNRNRSLKTIVLYGPTNLSSYGLQVLMDLPGLESLLLSFCNFSTDEKIEFGSSKETLKNLELAECKLDSNVLKAISECKKIESLGLRGTVMNDLTGPFEFGNLRYCLKEINLTYAKISPYFLKGISNCKKLRTLYLSKNILFFRYLNERSECLHFLSEFANLNPNIQIEYN